MDVTVGKRSGSVTPGSGVTLGVTSQNEKGATGAFRDKLEKLPKSTKPLISQGFRLVGRDGFEPPY